MKSFAVAILVPVFSGLILALSTMYIDVKELKATEPVRIKQMDRMELKIDKLIDYHMQPNNVNIIKKR